LGAQNEEKKRRKFSNETPTSPDGSGQKKKLLPHSIRKSESRSRERRQWLLLIGKKENQEGKKRMVKKHGIGSNRNDQYCAIKRQKRGGSERAERGKKKY